MIDHDKFLRHLIRKAIEMQSQTVSFGEGKTWEDAIIQLARDTYQPPSAFPQAAEHDVDVRYDRGCMR